MKKLGASLSSTVFEDIRGKTKENLLTGLTLNIQPMPFGTEVSMTSWLRYNLADKTLKSVVLGKVLVSEQSNMCTSIACLLGP